MRARRAMQPETYVRVPHPESGKVSVYPMRYLTPLERAAFLARAVSPL